MTLEEFINKYDPRCPGDCRGRSACDTRHPDTRAALAELAALREQKAAYAEHLRGCVPYIVVPNDAPAFKGSLAKARLEGAREAFGIAAAELRVSERGIEWDAALDAFLATFGEVAP